MRPCRVVSSVVVASLRAASQAASRAALAGLALGLVIAGSTPITASAQAWVGDKGSLDVSLDYNLAISSKVIRDGDLTDLEDAGTTSHEIALGGEYVILPKLAASVSLPLAFLKYTGNKTMYTHTGGGKYDDGDTHATLTDLKAAVRYQVLEEPVALSPHVGFSLPVADYETVGNTVAGRHLKALQLGFGVGRRLTDAMYAHLFYEFSLVERYDRTELTHIAGQNRSDASITIGYKLLDQRLDVHVDASGRITHGGWKFSDFGGIPLTDEEIMFHDPILAENIFLVGGGVSYQITDSVAANLGGRLFVAGRNTQNASVIAAGVSWSPL
jgi:hypothetical protein